MIFSKSSLLVGAATAAIFHASAVAQSVPQPSAPAGTAVEDADSEEIIVTAQKRQERLQDVPISITVLDGEKLDSSSATGVTEALTRVPGVAINIAGQGGGTQVTIRGVAPSAPLFGGSTPVAYYLDSVPFGLVKSAVTPDASVYDLERVEVLRGPQGTLYGANALSGVVRILTHAADLDDYSGKARASVSSTSHGGIGYRTDAAANVPLVPGVLAARAVIGYQEIAGWIDTPVRRNNNDGNIFNARLRLDAAPTDRLTIGLTSWFSRADYGAPGNNADEERRRGSLLPESQSTDLDMYGLTVGYDFGGVTLASSTSYLQYANTSFFDRRNYSIPNNRLETSLDADVFTQELLLNSDNSGAWRWSLGGMYRHAEDRNFQVRPDRIINGQLAPVEWTDTSESYAIFGELTRKLMDRKLEVTLGLRYFEDKVTLQERQDTNRDGSPLFRREETFKALTPRVAMTWHVNEDLTTYASYTEGFRSGSNQTPIILGSAPQFGPVEADRLRNYEVGAKGSVADGLLSFDASLFYTKWTDVQQLLLVNLFNAFNAAVLNAGTASGAGVDLSVTVRPTKGLSFGAGYGWNSLEIDKTVFFSPFDPTASTIYFEKGDRLNNSPEHTVSVFSDYSFDISDGFQGVLSASADWRSPQTNRSLFGGAITAQKGDSILVSRASVGVEADQKWSASFFIDNIFDEYGAVTPFVASDPAGPDGVTRVRPRTIGVQFELHF